MFRKPKYPNSGEVNTHATIGEEEIEVSAVWEGSPPEYDTNWPGDFEVVFAMHNDECQLHKMSKDEIADLTERVQEQVASDNDPDVYGDYLYEQEKDRRMGL